MSPLPLHPELIALADEYTTALLDIAQQAHQEEAVAQELDELSQLAQQVSGLEGFLDSPFITPESKQAAMDKALADQLSPLTRNFLGVLVRNGRGGMLAMIARRCRRMLNHRAGRIEVLVRSATPLEEQALSELKTALQSLLKAEPLLTLEIDESLLGGLQVEVGDEIIDASLSSQLKRLRQEMMGRRFTSQSE